MDFNSPKSIQPPVQPDSSPPAMDTSNKAISSTLVAHLDSRGCTSTTDESFPVDLTNPIYPLFSAKNFPDLNKKDYLWIDPALRLASHFITDESMQPFWSTLYHGDVKTEWRLGDEVQYIVHGDCKIDHKEKLRMKKETHGALGKIARGVKIVTLPSNEVAQEYERFGKPYIQGKDTDVSTFRIGVDPDVIEYIHLQASSTEATQKDAGQDLRFHFLLACGLVRSSVRLFFHHTHKDFVMGEEPYWDLKEQELELEPDLGASWEISTLGCKVLQWLFLSPLRKDSNKVLESPKIANACSIFLHTRHTVDTGIDTMYDHTTVLPMAWIHAWFKQGTWDNIHKQGLVKGRPAIVNAPILLGKDADDAVEWKLEKYDHEQLKQHGGFNTTDEQDQEWVYGNV